MGIVTPQKSKSLPSDMVLSLSLFIILLAFFIVLNGLSEFSDDKVEDAFGSLDVAFALSSLESIEMQTSSNQSNQSGEGTGTAMEDMQESLQSVLPNLDLEHTTHNNGGEILSVRFRKTKFEQSTGNILPVLRRIIVDKDPDNMFRIEFVSYVRDVRSKSSQISFERMDRYVEKLVESGVPPLKLSAKIDQGNPAMMMLVFRKMEKQR